MNVPPFVPQPIEIPGNVAEESRAVCLAFVRRTVALHFLSVLIVAGFAALPLPTLPLELTGALTLGMLLFLSLVRGLAKGWPLDLRLSVALMPPLLALIGLMARALAEAGWPVWAPVVGVVFSLAYTYLSGRDHSFVGQFVLGLLVSSIGIALIEQAFHQRAPGSAFALVANGAYLFYLVYDLAAILTRRRKGEELGAVVDLYRDVLNCLTYSVRVWRHWQKHRIWSLPR